jgi:hypothetical protein
MDENLRSWLWALSVIVAMIMGPIVVGGFGIYALAALYRRYRDVIGEKVKAVRVFHYGH